MQEVVAHQISVLPLVPSMFALVTAIAGQLPKEALTSLQVCISGGATLSPKVLKNAEETLEAIVLEGYGLTETSPVIAVNTPKLGSQPGSVGPVLANVKLRLTNEQGAELPITPGQASEEGEIEVQGPNIMLGYYNLPEATQEVLCNQGWFKTGDLGHINAKGHLVISGGRKKEIIIKAGENISPLRLEQALGEHHAIAELAVLGLPDERLGERICACIIPKEGVDTSTLETELKQFARDVLPPFLQPDEWLLAEDFPRTVTGKLLRRQLKEQLLAQRLTV
jgi:long-chain acyl-CoA synthetase